MPTYSYEFGFLGLLIASIVLWKHFAQVVLPFAFLLLADRWGWIDLDHWYAGVQLVGYGLKYSLTESLIFTTLAILAAAVGTLVALRNYFVKIFGSKIEDAKNR